MTMDELTQILHRTPRLRHLRLQWHAKVDLVKITEAHPYLVSIGCGTCFPSLTDDPYWKTSSDENPPLGIQLTTLVVGDIQHDGPLQRVLAVLNCPWGQHRPERLECCVAYKNRGQQITWIPIAPGRRCLRGFKYTIQNQPGWYMEDSATAELMSALILPVLTQCLLLRHVDINLEFMFDEVGEQLLPPIYKALTQLRHLENLNLSKACVDSELLGSLFHDMRRNGVPLETTGIVNSLHLFTQLAKIPTLRHIALDASDLSVGLIDFQFMDCFVNCLAESSTFKSFKLRNADVVRFSRTFQMLCGLPRLTHLTVADIGSPSENGLRHLVNIIQSDHRIWRL